MKPLHPIHDWTGEIKNRKKLFFFPMIPYFLSVIALATLRGFEIKPPTWLIVTSFVLTGIFIAVVLFVNWSDWQRDEYKFEKKMDDDFNKYARERE